MQLLILSGLLGSVMLVRAAMIVWFQPRLAARIGLGASILLWFEYSSLKDSGFAGSKILNRHLHHYGGKNNYDNVDAEQTYST